jgi:hypothetical protein
LNGDRATGLPGQPAGFERDGLTTNTGCKTFSFLLHFSLLFCTRLCQGLKAEEELPVSKNRFLFKFQLPTRG